MDSLYSSSYMKKHQLTDEGTEPTKLINHISALAPQFPEVFGDDSHKSRYLQRAVMKHEWAQQPIFQLMTSRYKFKQFITALNESFQLKEEISRARAAYRYYGQYVDNYRDMRKSR